MHNRYIKKNVLKYRKNMFDQWLIFVISDKVVGKKTQSYHIRPSSQPKLLYSSLIRAVELTAYPTPSNMNCCKLLPVIFRSDSSCNGKVKQCQLMAVRLVCCINHNALRKTSELLFCMIMHQKKAGDSFFSISFDSYLMVVIDNRLTNLPTVLSIVSYWGVNT